MFSSDWHFYDAPYNLPVWDIVEEDEVTKHGDEADETKTSNNVDYGVFKIKFSWLNLCKKQFFTTFL